jgi:hypothetical protein
VSLIRFASGSCAPAQVACCNNQRLAIAAIIHLIIPQCDEEEEREIPNPNELRLSIVA